MFDKGIELLSNVKTPGGTIKTKVFLDICSQVLPVITRLGTGFAIVKHDVGGNIDRLNTRMEQSPDKYSDNIFQIVLDEKDEGTCMESSSCTKGLLWLQRAMQFVLALLDHIRDPNYRDKTLSEIATETYYETLQKYHGWIVTGTFTVILKLVPNRDVFWNAITSNDDGESEQHRDDTMGQFCREFESLLSEIHSFLDSHGLDDPTKV